MWRGTSSSRSGWRTASWPMARCTRRWPPDTGRGSAPSGRLARHPTSLGTAPQGGVIASARDLGRYLQVMMNGEDDVLSASGKALMMRPASDASPFYGLGWFVDAGDGSVWHSGASPGVETLATMVPAEGRAVVVLVNGGSGIGFGEAAPLYNGIAAVALGREFHGDCRTLVAEGVVHRRWRCCRSRSCSASSGPGGIAARSAPSRARPGCSASGSRWPRRWGWWSSSSASSRGSSACRSAPCGSSSPTSPCCLIATALTGVAWAVFRLGVAIRNRTS